MSVAFNLIRPDDEERAAFSAWQAEFRRLEAIYSGNASTVDQLASVPARCSRLNTLSYELRAASLRASVKRKREALR